MGGNCGYVEEIQESPGQARLLGLNRRRMQSNPDVKRNGGRRQKISDPHGKIVQSERPDPQPPMMCVVWLLHPIRVPGPVVMSRSITTPSDNSSAILLTRKTLDDQTKIVTVLIK